ncbi:acyltransferase family protein, partial [Salmonella enterica]|uniref:acyltransferase family protein n=1 Tax=Salmonella enterica TaxID=28901 RepID=UPI00391B6312
MLKELNPTANHFLINGIFRLSVPLFLIITGYFFIRIETGKQFIKWLSRMLILYIVWSIIYLPFWLGDTKMITAIINIFNGYYALWY